MCFCHFFFFFKDPATTEIYTLSLHDALPIWVEARAEQRHAAGLLEAFLICPLPAVFDTANYEPLDVAKDRKSTRLNSSHTVISYAVFCLKKKKKKTINNTEIKSC